MTDTVLPSEQQQSTEDPAPNRRRRPAWLPHRAWLIAAITFVTMIGAAGFRSVPSVLMDPLNEEFGWSHGTVGLAVSINLLLYGLISPFAASLMDRIGIQRVVSGALLLVALGSGLTLVMSQVWQLMVLWGVLVGVGTGSMSMAFVATVASRWFVRRRGMVTGVLTAAGAAGQLIFLPLIAHLSDNYGWRIPSLSVAMLALAVIPLVLLWLHDHPHAVGLEAYGASEQEPTPPRAAIAKGSAARAVQILREASRRPAFWMLAGGFAICGASTNGLIGTHFVPAAHDHGMPITAAASLLAIVGIFDIAGTVLSGWLTDRVDPRMLLVTYYVLRGASLLLLPALLGPSAAPPMWAFIIFYGLDWVATVPPTVVLCQRHFGMSAPIVFGWVFASHQVGAAAAALGAGVIRDVSGSYAMAFLISGGLCFLAAGLSWAIRRQPADVPAEPLPATN